MATSSDCEVPATLVPESKALQSRVTKQRKTKPLHHSTRRALYAKAASIRCIPSAGFPGCRQTPGNEDSDHAYKKCRLQFWSVPPICKALSISLPVDTNKSSVQFAQPAISIVQGSNKFLRPCLSCHRSSWCRLHTPLSASWPAPSFGPHCPHQGCLARRGAEIQRNAMLSHAQV